VGFPGRAAIRTSSDGRHDGWDERVVVRVSGFAG
jgi:hypothetical protein